MEHISFVDDEIEEVNRKNASGTKIFERRQIEFFLQQIEFKHWRGFLRFQSDSPTAQYVLLSFLIPCYKSYFSIAKK